MTNRTEPPTGRTPPRAGAEQIRQALDLLPRALAYQAGGISVIPCSPLDKRPDCELLPKGGDGKATWKPFQEAPADEPTIRRWGKQGCRAYAAVCGRVSGGLLEIDFDEARFYDAWKALVGSLADGLPVQRTGREGGGYHVAMRCVEPGKNAKLAWVPDDSEETGRKCAVETRGEGGYILLPGSLHPSGRYYEAISGDFTKIPTVPQAVADALLAAARKLDEAPLTRQQMETRQRASETSNRHRAESNGQGSVIDEYNQRVSIADELKARAYTQHGDRWKRPGGKSVSVFVSEGRSFHHSSNDALNDGYWHRPFDVFCQLEHDGDCKAAVKAAAELLGLEARHPEHRLADAKPRKTKATQGPIEVYQPVPVDVFPSALQSYIETISGAIGCNPAFVVQPLLPALAGCIGNSRRIKLKSSWGEPSTIWGLVIAESGQHKSPAMKHVHLPLHDWQGMAFRQHEQDLAEHQAEVEEYDEAHKGRKRNDGPKPPKPTPPICQRYFVSDTTVEALVSILDEHPRGVPLFIDEGTSWFQGFGQYKGGRGGDVGHWLSMADAGPITVDRKAGSKQSVYIRRANVSIATGTQPETLRLDSSGNIHNGLLPRFLLAMPPRKRLVWTEAEVPESTGQILRNIYGRLLTLQGAVDEHEIEYPQDLPLTPEAKDLFAEFYNRHDGQQAELTGALATVWSKLVAYAGRLALVLHLTGWAADEEGIDPRAVDARSMESAIKLVEWYKAEARRVYATLNASDEDQDRQRLTEILQRHGRPVTPRDLAKLSRRYADSEAAEDALDDLAKCGFGRWQNQPPSDQGGRPTRRFVPNALVGETPQESAENHSFGYADTQESMENESRPLE